jgi:aspartate aminotransferase
MSLLSKKAQAFRPSPTLTLAAKAKEMKEQGIDVVSLTVGEPDWATYPKACEAGIQAIKDGKTKYTPASGIPALKKAICALTKDLIGIEYKPSQVTVTAGAKFIVFSAFQALLEPGEEVIIPAPFWASYAEMVELAGGKNTIVHTQESNKFKMTAAEFEKAITPKTKILLFNSPSNPTGVEYQENDLKAIAEVLRKYPNIAVVSDDIYNQLSFSEKGISPHLLQVAPDLKDRVICVNGASKAYSMTGWRIGWATGEEKIIFAMASYQSQTIGAPSSMGQEAAAAAISLCSEDVKNTRQVLRERVAHAYEAFSSIPGFTVTKPDGAFYLWINVAPVLKKLNMKTADDFARSLMEKDKVVVVPGDEFGGPNHIRISFAADRASIDKAVERIKKAVQ